MLDFLDLCKKPLVSRCKSCGHLVLIPTPRPTPVFYQILPILSQKWPREMGKGKHDLFLSACRLCSLGLRVTPCSSSSTTKQQNSFSSNSREGVPPPPQVAFPLQNNPGAGGVAVPSDPVLSRCGGGVDAYKKMRVHPLHRCFPPRRGFTRLGFWNKRVGLCWGARR